MSPEAQQITIAEACGWKRRPEVSKTKWFNPAFRGPGRSMWRQRLPDYLNDLNAIHEAEAFLENKYNGPWFGSEYSSDATEAYMNHLQDIVQADDWAFMGATSAQRAEAFLRTLNLWKD